ncbi:hypothetical protein ACIQCR_08455 [Streptomyces sp. NPDC093249]|uniref:hypothetical protein n=1 Tax=unclassified Streptomyces TaxID=2593676 RepID=UPI00344C9B5A
MFTRTGDSATGAALSARRGRESAPDRCLRNAKSEGCFSMSQYGTIDDIIEIAKEILHLILGG